MFFPDATHWRQLDEAGEVNELLLDFLFEEQSREPIR